MNWMLVWIAVFSISICSAARAACDKNVSAVENFLQCWNIRPDRTSTPMSAVDENLIKKMAASQEGKDILYRVRNLLHEASISTEPVLAEQTVDYAHEIMHLVANLESFRGKFVDYKTPLKDAKSYAYFSDGNLLWHYVTETISMLEYRFFDPNPYKTTAPHLSLFQDINQNFAEGAFAQGQGLSEALMNSLLIAGTSLGDARRGLCKAFFSRPKEREAAPSRPYRSYGFEATAENPVKNQLFDSPSHPNNNRPPPWGP